MASNVSVKVIGRYGPTLEESPVVIQVEGNTPAIDFVRALQCEPELSTIFVDGEEVEQDYLVSPSETIIIAIRPGEPTTILLIISLVLTILSTVLQLTVFKPSVPKQKDLDSAEGSRFKGLRNNARPYEPVPRAYGNPRHNPPLAAGWSTDNEGKRGRITGLLVPTLSEPGLTTVTEVMLGDTPVSDETFAGFVSEVVEIDNDGVYTTSPVLYSDSVQEVDPQGQLKFVFPESETLTQSSSPGAHKVELTYFWPNGLGRIGDSGSRDGTPQDLIITFRVAGSTDPFEPWRTIRNDSDIRTAFFQTFTFTPPDPSLAYEFQSKIVGVGGSKQFSSNDGGDGDTLSLFGNVDWVAVRSFFPGQPILQPNTSLYAFRLISSDILDGVPDTITVNIDSKVRDIDFDGGTGIYSLGDWVSSTNPALIALDILTNPVANAAPIPASRIDLASFADWKDTCNAQGWEFRGVFDQKGESVFAAAEKVARTGWASLDYSIDLLRPIVDVPQPMELTLSPYIANMKISKVYPAQADAYRVKFRDASTPLWVDSETFVFNFNPATGSAHTLKTAKIIEEVAAAEGIVDRQQVRKRVFFESQHKFLSPEVISATVSLRSLVMRRGTVVGITYPQIGVGNESTQLVARTVLPNNDVQLTFPSEYVVQATDLMVIDYPNGTIQQLSVPPEFIGFALRDVPALDPVSGSSQALALLVSLDTDGANGDDLLAHIQFGPAGVVNRKMRVRSISYNADLTADLELEPAVDAVFAAALSLQPLNPEDTVLARPQAGIPLSPAAPRIDGLHCETTANGPIDCTFSLLPGSGTGAQVPIDSYRITYQHTIARPATLPEQFEIPASGTPTLGSVNLPITGQALAASGNLLVATLPFAPLDQSNFTGGNKAIRWTQFTDDVQRQILHTRIDPVSSGVIVPDDAFAGLYFEFDSSRDSLQVVFDRLAITDPEPTRIISLLNLDVDIPFNGFHQIVGAGTILDPPPPESAWLRVIRTQIDAEETAQYDIAWQPVNTASSTIPPAELDPSWIVVGSFKRPEKLTRVGFIAGRWNGETAPTTEIKFSATNIVSEPDELGAREVLSPVSLTVPFPAGPVVVPGVSGGVRVVITARSVSTDGRISLASKEIASLVELDTPGDITLTSTSILLGPKVIPILRAVWDSTTTLPASQYIVTLLDERLATLDEQVQAEARKDYTDLPAEVYTVRVRSVGIDGRVSLPREKTIDYRPVVGVGSTRPTGLKLVGFPGNIAEFQGRDLSVEWVPISDPAISFDHYEVRVLDGVTKALRRTEQVLSNGYVYSHSDNEEDGLTRSLIIEVRIVTTDGEKSQPGRNTFSNTAPELLDGVVLTVGPTGGAVLQFTLSTLDPDFAGVKVWSGTTSGFIADDNTLVATIPASPTENILTFTNEAHTAGLARYYRVAGYDAFGGDETSLNISGSILVVAAGLAPNSVGLQQLEDNAITATKLAEDFLDDAAWDKIASDTSLTKVAGVVGTQIIGQGIIQAAHIGAAQIGTVAIADGAITNVKILEVDGAKIQDLTVDSIKILSGAATKQTSIEQPFSQIFNGTDEGITREAAIILTSTVGNGLGGKNTVIASINIDGVVSQVFVAGPPLGLLAGAAFPVVTMELQRKIISTNDGSPPDPTWVTVATQSGQISSAGQSSISTTTRLLQVPASNAILFRVNLRWNATVYNAGTAKVISADSNNNQVTGIGTRWNDHLGPTILLLTAPPRFEMRLPTLDPTWRAISSVIDNTSLVMLGSAFTGALNTAVPYETRWLAGQGPALVLDAARSLQILDFRR